MRPIIRNPNEESDMSEQARGFDIAMTSRDPHLDDHRTSHEGKHEHTKGDGKRANEKNPDLPVRVDPEPGPKGNAQK